MELQSHEHGPHKTGHHMFDMFISGCALLISAFSIYMGWDTGKNMEQLVQANSWPFLQMGSGNVHAGDRNLTFGVSNAGTGPARIHTFEIIVDDKAIPSSGSRLREMLKACCGELLLAELARAKGDDNKVVGAEYSSYVARSFLPAREKVTAQSWPRSEDNAALWDALDRARQKGRINLRSCYCSVFDECWIAETHLFPPRKVDRCPETR